MIGFWFVVGGRKLSLGELGTVLLMPISLNVSGVFMPVCVSNVVFLSAISGSVDIDMGDTCTLNYWFYA